jgi:hypothetical protein
LVDGSRTVTKTSTAGLNTPEVELVLIPNDHVRGLDRSEQLETVARQIRALIGDDVKLDPGYHSVIARTHAANNRQFETIRRKLDQGLDGWSVKGSTSYAAPKTF